MSEPFLFKTLDFYGQKLKNRMVLAPMTRGRAGPDRVPNDVMADYYQQRAGAGLLITEATVISPEGIGWVDSPGIYTEAMVAGWRKVTERVRAAGSPIILQLWHCGRASHSDFHDGESPLSASAVKISSGQIHTPKGKKDYETPRPMSIEQIKATVGDFKRAAQYAKDAGFSGVEVHGANGYLINQFLDPGSNLREDGYGGSIENRFRFFSEVLDAVLEIWPAKHVGTRISPNGVYNDMGSDDFRETFTYAIEQINSKKLGYLHVMDGLGFGFHEKGEPMTLAEIRPMFDGILIGNCAYDQASAEQQLSAGHADMIAFGRPFITNPDLPERMKNGWPLTPWDDMTHWYTAGAKGYSDYPTFEAQQTAQAEA